MSDESRGLEGFHFECINPNLPIENPRVLKDLRFEYSTPIFELPSEENPVMEHEWAMIRTLFVGPQLIDDEKVNADTKGNKPVDEELFTEETIKRLTEPEGAAPRNSEHYETLVLDIETYTKHALKLQLAIIEADSKLAKATRKHQKASARVREASKEWDEAEAALDDAMDEFKKRLDIIRDTHVTLRKGPHE